MLTNIRRVGVAVIFLFALTAFVSVSAWAQDRAADFSFRNIDGPAVTSESLRGEVVVLAFGASWLPLTKNQMEAVKRINTGINQQKNQQYAAGKNTQNCNRTPVGPNHRYQRKQWK